jgi:hypothetical protein
VSPNGVVLVVTIALFSVYVIGVGITTATAIRVREAWRHRKIEDAELAPTAGREVVLSAPALPAALLRLRTAGWIAFVPALGLAVFAVHDYPWVAPFVVILMVALNAFYFTAMQNIGEQLTFTQDGFRVGVGSGATQVRWVHVTELVGARIGGFGGAKMPDEDEWQDPRLRPNVILYRLNRALTPTHQTVLHRLIGFSYYDGVIRNAFGVPTTVLVRSMREWQKRALEAEKLPLRPARP